MEPKSRFLGNGMDTATARYNGYSQIRQVAIYTNFFEHDEGFTPRESVTLSRESALKLRDFLNDVFAEE